MPIDQTVFVTTGGINLAWLWWSTKFLVILLASSYFFFSLVIVRQINLMTETLMTESSPLLRAFAIIHAGLALGIIILFIGILFA